MSLRKEVLYRLLLAKSVLSPYTNTMAAWPNPYLVAKQLLSAHDAADLVFASIADHQRKLPAKGKAPSMLECLDLVHSSTGKHAGYFKQLNDARNSLKHVGNLPNTNQWGTVGQDVFAKLSQLCSATLGISLEDADESELLSNAEVKTFLAEARTAAASQDFRLALEAIGKALFVTLEDAPDMGVIDVGRAKAEDALKLTAYGVSANDFLRLQEFMPRVSGLPLWATSAREPLEVGWVQSQFGHPVNWNGEVVDFCLRTCIHAALSLQGAPPIPYAREFSHFYDYRVTAKNDQVEVWEDLIDESECTANVGADWSRPCRVHNRFLKKNESVVVRLHGERFVSDDLSLSGEPMKRVRISYDEMGGMGGLLGRAERAEYVNLADVDIMCIPTALGHDQFPNLPVVPWEEDPLI